VALAIAVFISPRDIVNILKRRTLIIQNCNFGILLILSLRSVRVAFREFAPRMSRLLSPYVQNPQIAPGPDGFER
ncbi:unnamed protein product, partial [Acidithrix sp. C25]